MTPLDWKKWFKNRAADYLTHIYKSKTVTIEDGTPKVSWNGFEHRDQVEVLANAIDTNIKHSHRALSAAVRQTMFEVKNYDRVEFLKRTRVNFDKKFSGNNEYIFLSSVNLPSSFPIRSVKTPAATVRFLPRANPASVKQLKSEQNALCKELGVEPDDCNFLVRIDLKAPDAEDAYDTASEELLLVRSALNLCINLKKHSNFTLGGSLKAKPVNDVLPSAIASVHHPNKKPAYKGLWVEQLGQRVTPNIEIDWARVLPNFFSTMRALRKSHGLSDEARTVLRIYGKALDNNDFPQAYLSLWMMLEHLVLNGNESHEEISRRTSKLWVETDLARIELEHLRVTRNRFVHSRFEGTSDQNSSVIYHLHRYANAVLVRVIFNHMGFSSKADLISFLKLDHSETALLALEENIKRAKRFIFT
jgi:hypothetical protein